jgi:hypothetical protein
MYDYAIDGMSDINTVYMGAARVRYFLGGGADACIEINYRNYVCINHIILYLTTNKLVFNFVVVLITIITILLL